MNPDELELAPGSEHDNLQGWRLDQIDDAAALHDALEKAFSYRGDVTITRKDGTQVEGYIFDRRAGSGLSDSLVRLYPKDSSDKVNVPYDAIAGLAFTGRDTAAGKTFEAWMKKYFEKKAAGEKHIELTPEEL